MGRDPPVGLSASSPPIDVETRRIGVLLSDVSTRTLLRTLASLDRQNDDASLIIAALLDRFPPGEDDTPAA